MSGKYNLVLVAWDGTSHTWDDLRRIGSHVSEIDPRISVHVVNENKGERWRLAPLWRTPTLCVAMQRRRGSRKLLPGRLLTPRSLGKHGEYARLAAAGFPVPKWTVITPDTKLDPEEWGPYVIEKPDRGGLGAYVRIRKTERVAYRPPDTLEPDHYGRKGMLAQEFIYTGPWPASYRVLTLLGHVLHCRIQITRKRGNPLPSRWDFRTGGINVVSNTMDMEVKLVEDAEMIALCERAHREAFADVPLLGFDLVRDAETGALSIIECHAHGPSWSFSSSRGLGVQKTNGLNFETQFDAFRKAARILATATPLLAARRWPFQEIPESWEAAQR